MDEEVLEEIRYYESERDDAEETRDRLERELEDLDRKNKKNEELTKQYNKMVADLNLVQKQMNDSEGQRIQALSNFNKNFEGNSAKKILDLYNTSFKNMSTINKNLTKCKGEADTKLKKLAAERKVLEKQITDKQEERRRQNDYIGYCNRKLDELY